MADTLLHVTCARRLARDPRIAPKAGALLESNTDDLALGAVMHDLPFYENLLLAGVRKLRGVPQKYSRFGQRIHERHCRSLCTHALEAADTPSRFAIAAGLISHFTLDMVFHKEIERRRHSTGATHEAIESEMGLHCHYDLLGHGGVGNPYCRDALELSPTPGWEADWYAWLTEYFDDVPGIPYFHKCFRGLRLFGYLHSTRHLPWVNVLAADDVELAKTSLRLLDESMEKSARFIGAAFEVYEGRIPIEAFTASLPPVLMSDGLFEL